MLPKGRLMSFEDHRAQQIIPCDIAPPMKVHALIGTLRVSIEISELSRQYGSHVRVEMCLTQALTFK